MAYQLCTGFLAISYFLLARHLPAQLRNMYIQQYRTGNVTLGTLLLTLGVDERDTGGMGC